MRYDVSYKQLTAISVKLMFDTTESIFLIQLCGLIYLCPVCIAKVVRPNHDLETIVVCLLGGGGGVERGWELWKFEKLIAKFKCSPSCFQNGQIRRDLRKNTTVIYPCKCSKCLDTFFSCKRLKYGNSIILKKLRRFSIFTINLTLNFH